MYNERMITTKEVLAKYGIHRPELFYRVKAGSLKMIQKIENGRTVNYYDEKEIESLRKTKKDVKP